MKTSIITIILLTMGWTAYAQPNRQKLTAHDDLNEWVTDPPYTILVSELDGGSTERNAYGTVTYTDEYGTLFPTPCYFLTDRYSVYAQKLGPQTYIIATTGVGDEGILYSVKGNKINPNCAKEFDWKLMPRFFINVPYEYDFKTPINYYRLNKQGQRVLKKDKFPEIIQKLFQDFPEYYEKYSPLCKAMNFNDPYYVSLLIEALIRYDKPCTLTKIGNVTTFCTAGFKTPSGKTTFRVMEYMGGNVAPLERVIPASKENDEIMYYNKDKRSYSRNYLNQVEATKTIPQDYSHVQFNGEPCLLTDLYGFPAVFDNSKMYYIEQ